MLWMKDSGDGNWYSEDRLYSIHENERGNQLFFEGLSLGYYSSDQFAKMSAEQHAAGRNQANSIRNRKQSYDLLESNSVEEINRLWEDHYRAD